MPSAKCTFLQSKDSLTSHQCVACPKGNNVGPLWENNMKKPWLERLRFAKLEASRWCANGTGPFNARIREWTRMARVSMSSQAGSGTGQAGKRRNRVYRHVQQDVNRRQEICVYNEAVYLENRAELNDPLERTPGNGEWTRGGQH